jgi:hypothetical protein
MNDANTEASAAIVLLQSGWRLYTDQCDLATHHKITSDLLRDVCGDTDAWVFVAVLADVVAAMLRDAHVRGGPEPSELLDRFGLDLLSHESDCG